MDLKQGKFRIDYDGTFKSFNGKQGKILIDEGCVLISSEYIESKDTVVLFNHYDCGPESYNELVCLNAVTGKELWTRNEYFGYTPSIVKINNEIIIPGHYTVGKVSCVTGKIVWQLDLEKKHHFANVETYEIEDNELTLSANAYDSDHPGKWKLVTIKIDLATGLEK